MAEFISLACHFAEIQSHYCHLLILYLVHFHTFFSNYSLSLVFYRNSLSDDNYNVIIMCILVSCTVFPTLISSTTCAVHME